MLAFSLRESHIIYTTLIFNAYFELSPQQMQANIILSCVLSINAVEGAVVSGKRLWAQTVVGSNAEAVSFNPAWVIIQTLSEEGNAKSPCESNFLR